MFENLAALTVEAIKNGYTFQEQTDSYVCNYCGRIFENGEIFLDTGRYYEASKMIKNHIRKEHPDMLDILLSCDRKAAGFTENQKELLKMIHSGMSDNEIAKKTGVAPATVRHQRFSFREKAKQAKLYLSIYELAIHGAEGEKQDKTGYEEMIDVHMGARMVDDRYIITKKEEQQILDKMFTSISPLKLKTFSTKEKNKIVILRKIAEQFEQNRRYTEKELNGIIGAIYEDFATIRRYLIEYGFMERTNNCREYWVL